DNAFKGTLYQRKKAEFNANWKIEKDTLVQYKGEDEIVEIPDTVNIIGDDAFEFCKSITSIIIPNSVISIGRRAFKGCSKLKSITIPGSVKEIGEDSFLECHSLEEVHISDLAAWCKIDFEGEEANPLAFSEKLYLNGKLITDLVIPDGVTSIGAYAFIYCTSLKSVTIPSSVTSIGESAFSCCGSIEKVHINDLAAWCRIDFGCGISNPTAESKILYLNGKSITDLVIPDGVTSIGDYAFRNIVSLTSVVIPNGVREIGERTFSFCNELTSIVIPNSVTKIGKEAFFNCTSLTSVTMPKNLKSIRGDLFPKDIVSLFSKCKFIYT
ncbi:MAG: leucine-rich repeat domain-containing protein, partial [Candidatus Coproplasma sp.]